MNEPNNTDRDRILKMVEQHARQLSEHFDSVQIFCTNQESGTGDTTHYAFGQGNWFARYGQVAEWFEYQKGMAGAKGADDQRRHD